MKQFYYRICRWLSPLAIAGLRLYSAMTKQVRARVVLINELDEILLVKNVVGPDEWTLPGGGIGRHESPIKAAQREINEELHLRISTSQLIFIADYPKGVADILYNAAVYYATVRKRSLRTENYQWYEIAEVAWFNRQELPSKLSSITRLAIADLPS
jgi:ADP-ribose pyrophosphatase YjhB (NUDIX family)